MSVHVTLQVNADPAAFEAQAAAHPEVIERIMGIARRHGVISHRWIGDEAGCMAIDEWPDAASFQAFFEEAGPEIGPLMQAIGATAPPEVRVWRHVELRDLVGGA